MITYYLSIPTGLSYFFKHDVLWATELSIYFKLSEICQ